MSTRKRVSYSTGFKLNVIDFAKLHGNHAAEKRFGSPPNRSVIIRWRKQEEKLRETSRNKRADRGKPAKWPNLEKRLKRWVEAQRQTGASVSTKMILDQARRIAKEMQEDKRKGIETEETGDFTGASHWCFKFMKRNHLSMRTKTKLAQKMPKDYEEKVLAFHAHVIKTRKMMNFDLNQIGNMDEVPLTFDVPSNRTVDLKGIKTVAIKTSGHEKDHFTCVLACCADGTKLPPMLIFKRKTMPKGKLPPGIFVHVQEKGWMDQTGMDLWFKRIWNKRPGALLKEPAMLVIDSFRGHLTTDVKKMAGRSKTHLVVIPGGLTSQLQPLDVSINKPFKGLMREEWNKWMQRNDTNLTPSGKVRKPTIPEVCQWVLTAWEGIKNEIVVKSFKKCGISNNLDGSEDEVIYEDSVYENTASGEAESGDESDDSWKDEFQEYYD